MDSERWRRVRALFEEALDRAPQERPDWLAEACADPDLREEVERMLAVETPADFLENPEDAVAPARSAEIASGRRIGNYEVVRLLASGGMGVVYEAVQERPRRKVALKVMRLGLGTSSALRRFQYEAEVLARLVHPGIAQIHEAGVHSEDGVETPFFAMEFVEGAQDLITYARELDLPARLGLFHAVCEAVHHGHLRGVIHRDLKPANLLVDEGGRTKVIDFGVARLADPDADLLTAATRTGELVGTLWYMSPEQLAGDPSEVDARADVYALGVVLYELVCGRLPYDLQGLPLTAVARAVAETPPRAPGPDVPEELRWVLLRALEKDPGRRYGSASELAQELSRFLEHEPVLAGPPSTVYRLRKFARRHRVWVGAAAAVVLALVGGTVAALIGLSRARQETARAEDESAKFREINDVLVETMSAAQLGRDGRDVRVVELLDRAAGRIGARLEGRPAVRAGLELALAQSYLSLGLRAEGAAQARLALASLADRPAGDGERLAAQRALASCLIDMDRSSEAAALLEQATAEASAAHGPEDELTIGLERLALRAQRALAPPAELEPRLLELEERARAHLGPDHPETLALGVMRVRNLRDLSRPAEAAEHNDALVEAYARLEGADGYQVLDRRLAGAEILYALGRRRDAIDVYEQWLQPWTERFGEEHPLVLRALSGYAMALMETGRAAEADALLTPLVPVMERALGPDHVTALGAASALARARLSLGDEERGEATLRALVASARRVWGPDHLRTAEHEVNLGAFLADTGGLDRERFREADGLLTHALEVRRRDLPPDHEQTLYTIDALGLLAYRRGDWASAERCFRETWQGYRRELGETHPDALVAISNLASSLAQLGRYDDALPVAVESLRLNLATREEDDPALITMTANIGALHLLREAPQQALDYYQRALERAARYLPPDAPQVQVWRRAHAEVLAELGRDEEALAVLARVVEATALGDPNAHSTDLLEYARCLDRVGETERAIEQLELTYEIRVGLAGEGHSATREVARELARVCAAAGRDEEAATWRELAGGQ